MASKRQPKAGRSVRSHKSTRGGGSGLGDGTGAEAGTETGAKPAGYVGPAGKAGTAGRMESLETPPVADPAKSEKPPKPGYSVHGKKIGRPTKEMIQTELEEKRAKTIEDFSRALPGIVELPFKAVASKRGEHWLLDNDSRDALCQSIKSMMFAYLPLNLGRYLPVVMFGVILTGVISSRYVEDVKLAIKRKKEARERASSGPGIVGERENPAA